MVPVYLKIILHKKLAEKHECEFGGFGDVSADFGSINFEQEVNGFGPKSVRGAQNQWFERIM